jgi:hypothetical protein
MVSCAGAARMRVAIMQPYFLPYIGYFQLIAAVDTFVVYDNIKYTKKGWINRNRLLSNGRDVMFSLPLKQDSDALDVVQRELAADFNRAKLLNQLRGAYAKAPYFPQTWPLLERLISYPQGNLFRFIHYSLEQLCAYLGITTPIRIASEIDIDHGLKAQDKVLALCQALGAQTYVNAIGGTELYSKEAFRAVGIDLRFLRALPFEYAQFGAPFVPWLSMVDVMMFNSVPAIQSCITTNYELI